MKSTEKEDTGCPCDIVSDKSRIETQRTQDAPTAKAEEQEGEERVVPPKEERSSEEDHDVVRLEGEAEHSDYESVAATCSDIDRSEGSTMQLSTESEEYTLNGSVEEARGQDDPKPPEQVGNQLELEN